MKCSKSTSYTNTEDDTKNIRNYIFSLLFLLGKMPSAVLNTSFSPSTQTAIHSSPTLCRGCYNTECDGTFFPLLHDAQMHWSVWAHAHEKAPTSQVLPGTSTALQGMAQPLPHASWPAAAPGTRTVPSPALGRACGKEAPQKSFLRTNSSCE